MYSRLKYNVQQGSHLLPLCWVISLLNENRKENRIFMEKFIILYSKYPVPFFYQLFDT